MTNKNDKTQVSENEKKEKENQQDKNSKLEAIKAKIAEDIKQDIIKEIKDQEQEKQISSIDFASLSAEQKKALLDEFLKQTQVKSDRPENPRARLRLYNDKPVVWFSDVYKKIVDGKLGRQEELFIKIKTLGSDKEIEIPYKTFYSELPFKEYEIVDLHVDEEVENTGRFVEQIDEDTGLKIGKKVELKVVHKKVNVSLLIEGEKVKLEAKYINS